MTFSIPLFLSVLFTLFILPVFGLIFQESEKKRLSRNKRTVKDIETLALGGWILVVNRFSRQSKELVQDLNQFKKLCKENKKVFLPIYDVTHERDLLTLLELTANTVLNKQLKGGNPLHLFLPIIFNVESQVYTSLPAFTTPKNLWRHVFELEKNELIHKDVLPEFLLDDIAETDEKEEGGGEFTSSEEEEAEVESNVSSVPSHLPDLLDSDEERAEMDVKEDEIKEDEIKEDEIKEEEEQETNMNFLFKEILKFKF